MSSRAWIKPSSLDEFSNYAIPGEGSWSSFCFALPNHRSNPTGSYSDDRNKTWPQSPAIQLYNPSTTSVLSQKDNNANVLILPTSPSLQCLASPGEKAGWVRSTHPWMQGKIMCLAPSQHTHILQTRTRFSSLCLWPTLEQEFLPGSRDLVYTV